MVNYHPPGAFPTAKVALAPGKTSAIVDTNVLIFYLDQTNPDTSQRALIAIDDIDVRYTSSMCYMEVMVGYRAHHRREIATALTMFQGYRILPQLAPIEELAIAIRRSNLEQAHAQASKSGKNLITAPKLPDAIIKATAMFHGLPILTDNDADFRAVDAAILKKFRVSNVALIIFPRRAAPN